jgi:predicted transcriptional regulator
MTNFEQLGARERQIVEAVYRLEEGSVNDVITELADPPSYSAVRAIRNILVEKGYLDYRQVKNKYVYRPARSKKAARKTLLRNVLDNFFGGRTTEAVAALLDDSKLNDAEYQELRRLIDHAKNRQR